MKKNKKNKLDKFNWESVFKQRDCWDLKSFIGNFLLQISMPQRGIDKSASHVDFLYYFKIQKKKKKLRKYK